MKKHYLESLNDEKNKSAKRTIHRIVKTAGITLLATVLILCIGIIVLFRHELAALSTLKQVDDTVLFTMEYRGDYGFDKFLQQGASSDGDVVSFVSGFLLKGIPLQFDLPDFGCSTFAAKTPDDEYIFGRNYDFDDTVMMMMITLPDNGYASLSAVDLSFIGYHKDNLPTEANLLGRFLVLAAPYAPLDGINEMGVSIGVLRIFDNPTDQKTDNIDITTTTAIRLVLDKAASTKEAVSLLSQYDMHSSAGSCFHFQIADASGSSAVVEYIDNQFTVIETDCATNFLLSPGDWKDEGKGYDRYDMLKDTLKQSNGILTQQQGMELLSSVSQPLTADAPTQWSIIFNNTRKTAMLCIKRDYDTVYQYSLD